MGIVRFGFAPSEFDSSISATRVLLEKHSYSGQFISRNINVRNVLSQYAPIWLRRACAVTAKTHSRKRLLVPEYTSTAKSLLILLPPSYLEAFQSCGALTPGHRQRFQFFVAVALVHELANAVVRLRFPTEMAKGKTIWYYHKRDRFNATPGMAWEREMFQGTIRQQRFLSKRREISDKCPCSAGLVLDRGIYSSRPDPTIGGAIGDIELPPYTRVAPKESLASKLVILKMGWVNKWFRKCTWDGMSRDEGVPTAETGGEFAMYTGSGWRHGEKFIVCPK